MQSCLECDRLWRDYVGARAWFCALLKETNSAASAVSSVRGECVRLRALLLAHTSQCAISTAAQTPENSTATKNSAGICWRSVPTDLNRATADEIAAIPLMNAEGAENIVLHRPYTNWRDLQRIPGFSRDMASALIRGGAKLGS